MGLMAENEEIFSNEVDFFGGFQYDLAQRARFLAGRWNHFIWGCF